MPWWGWLIVGFFVGGTLGVLTGGLMCAAGKASESERRMGDVQQN